MSGLSSISPSTWCSVWNLTLIQIVTWNMSPELIVESEKSAMRRSKQTPCILSTSDTPEDDTELNSIFPIYLPVDWQQNPYMSPCSSCTDMGRDAVPFGQSPVKGEITQRSISQTDQHIF
ncbi:hypothetical protein J6590_056856 [Homalodisca vitripennis]|nr:hypothetical protein J6590_056856 [Homalodisca vitripennis]